MAKKGKDYPNIDILPSGHARIRKTEKGVTIRVTGETPEEAYAKYLEEKAKIEKGEVKPKKPTVKTLGEAMDDYISHREAARSPVTIRGYNFIRKNAYQELMPLRMDKITQDQWQDAVDADIRAGLSAKTIKNRMDLVRSVYKEEEVRLPKLSLPSVAKSKDDTEEFVRFLDDAELEVFCKAIYGHKYELPCYLALNGLRRSEIYGMSWDKISVEKKKLVVQGAVVPDNAGKMVHKKENKNAASTRTVPILFPRILELVQQADQTKPIIKEAPSNLHRYIDGICEKNGLNEVGIHGLRHTGASLCVYKEVKKKAIMQWFGWSVPDTLEKIYLHISQRQKDLEAEKVIAFTSTLK